MVIGVFFSVAGLLVVFGGLLAAADSALLRLGLHTPRISASRTPWKDCMWNRALNPEPMKPMPSGLRDMGIWE